MTTGQHQNDPHDGLQKPVEDRPARVPGHVAFIMDGNGRWAERQGLPRKAGHVAGVERLREITKASYQWGVPLITCFAFSTENWNRPAYEVQVLMQLFRRYMLRGIDELDGRNVRVKMIGERHRLPKDLQRLVAQTEERTADNTRMTIQVAVSYGARAEMTDTLRRIAAEVAAGRLAPEAIDEAMISSSLWTAEMPDPDLIVRTSGEHRISNFLLWQAAYAEYAFVDECWPDFTRARYRDVLEDFARRDRRYGGLAAVEKTRATR
ncbi:MAG: polyprenyl diphosphate synthase [Pseudomonadota bacterium]